MKRKGGAATPPAAAARQEDKHSRTQPGGLLAASSPSDDDTSAAATAFRERAVFKVAILSRVLMLLIATFLGEMFSDFDDSTAASSSSSANATALPTKLDGMVETSVGHLAKWDGVYFVDIAQHGYRFEHFHAFFPALPLAISFLNRTFLKVLWVKGFASEYNSAVMAGVFVTNAFFVLSAVELYRLSRLVVKKEIFATKTVLLYCLTPANIFMTAIYSESVFAFFFLRGVRLLLEQKRWESALTLAGTCLTRSNGALCCLFLVYDALQRCPPPFLQSLSVAVFRKRLSFVTAQRPSWTTFLAVWLGTALRCAVVVAPLVGYLAWSYLRYCSPTNPTRGQHEWCDAAVPNIYAHVQAKYWNVGLLNYYEPHQIPNFLLASPIVFLSAWGVFSFLRRFSFFTTSPSSSSTTTPSSSSSTPSSSSSSSSTSVPAEPYLEAAMVPFVGYWAVLVVVGVLFMHVQVITRFLSACPALYWFCASFYDGTGADDVSSSTTKPKNESEAAKEERRRKRRRARQVRSWTQYLIAFYFLAYTLIGALLFCNFYPWT